MRKNFGVKPWFYPLPVLIVGSYDENGQADAMNAAWGGLYDANLVELCLSSGHKTTKNIKATGAFTISFADAKNVAKCDYVGIVSANNTPDKMEKAGFTVTKSSFVNAPIIEELPMTLESVSYTHLDVYKRQDEANAIYNDLTASQEEVNNAFDRLASAMHIDVYKRQRYC